MPRDRAGNRAVYCLRCKADRSRQRGAWDWAGVCKQTLKRQHLRTPDYEQQQRTELDGNPKRNLYRPHAVRVRPLRFVSRRNGVELTPTAKVQPHGHKENKNMNQIQAMRKILDGVVEAVKTNQAGTPEGFIYAILTTHGCSLEQYQAIIGALCKTGKIRKEGHLLFAI